MGLFGAEGSKDVAERRERLVDLDGLLGTRPFRQRAVEALGASQVDQVEGACGVAGGWVLMGHRGCEVIGWQWRRGQEKGVYAMGELSTAQHSTAQHSTAQHSTAVAPQSPPPPWPLSPVSRVCVVSRVPVMYIMKTEWEREDSAFMAVDSVARAALALSGTRERKGYEGVGGWLWGREARGG